jgi:hypothetical protein
MSASAVGQPEKDEEERPEVSESDISESGEEDDEEDEEEDEPKLRYQRLGASVSDILTRDDAAAMAVHEKVRAAFFPLSNRVLFGIAGKNAKFSSL